MSDALWHRHNRGSALKGLALISRDSTSSFSYRCLWISLFQQVSELENWCVCHVLANLYVTKSEGKFCRENIPNILSYLFRTSFLCEAAVWKEFFRHSTLLRSPKGFKIQKFKCLIFLYPLWYKHYQRSVFYIFINNVRAWSENVL